MFHIIYRRDREELSSSIFNPHLFIKLLIDVTLELTFILINYRFARIRL